MYLNALTHRKMQPGLSKRVINQLDRYIRINNGITGVFAGRVPHRHFVTELPLSA